MAEAEEVQLPDMDSYGADDRMMLTAAEIRWALRIKEAVSKSADQEALSDFEYAIIALRDHDDLEQSLYRVEQLQHFRGEFVWMPIISGVRRAVATVATTDYFMNIPLLVAANLNGRYYYCQRRTK